MRAAKSQWSVSPETIMTHHFRMAKGIPAVVDSSPPFSMYNSPSSSHYVLKTRASSADPRYRKPLSKSQRELDAFVGKSKFDRPPRPFTPMHNFAVLVKPKLLGNRNYQPPRRHTNSAKHAETSHAVVEAGSSNKLMKITKFKDDVLTDIIKNGAYTNWDIVNVIRGHMEDSAGIIPWNDLEVASAELLDQLGMKDADLNQKFSHSAKQSRRKSSNFKDDHESLDLSSLSSSGNSSKSSSTGSSSSSSGTSSSGSS